MMHWIGNNADAGIMSPVSQLFAHPFQSERHGEGTTVQSSMLRYQLSVMLIDRPGWMPVDQADACLFSIDLNF